MKLCRFNSNRLGLVLGDEVADVSEVLDGLPCWNWVPPAGDPVIAALDTLRPRIEALAASAPRLPIAGLQLDAPVAAPSKVIGAPVNYHDHLEEANTDSGIHHGSVVHPIDQMGCFLKAVSALAGHGAVLELPFTDRRVDHEAEIAVVIGRSARRVSAAAALEHVAGYALALDMTVRGTQERSLRKSCDGFAVLGPWLTTADEIADPGAIGFELTVNGETRQASDTRLLIRSIPELIEMVSAYYTLHPGDVIMTGTPAGVSPVSSGDQVSLTGTGLGRLEVVIG
ncbi:MAG: fumarylacetoacetate hydrolase family protein [Pararhodobacter sp.]|nr:fumarylacetoacetate hydrolase family protein [Pararhodobacter sp.]